MYCAGSRESVREDRTGVPGGAGVSTVVVVMAEQLLVERRTLEENLPRLRATARDQFVLIHGATVIGTFPTEGTALREGYRMFGPRGVFLIDEIGADERPRVVTYLLDHSD